MFNKIYLYLADMQLELIHIYFDSPEYISFNLLWITWTNGNNIPKHVVQFSSGIKIHKTIKFLLTGFRSVEKCTIVHKTWLLLYSYQKCLQLRTFSSLSSGDAVMDYWRYLIFLIFIIIHMGEPWNT